MPHRRKFFNPSIYVVRRLDVHHALAPAVLFQSHSIRSLSVTFDLVKGCDVLSLRRMDFPTTANVELCLDFEGQMIPADFKNHPVLADFFLEINPLHFCCSIIIVRISS